ncbi:MAG TPA: ketol-acid reductoisomerase [Candidatus Dormibacteraeota bacterium]|nr:ketol-acid reductoisomerase [Candidatus Dormibacteraeota bacterium]
MSVTPEANTFTSELFAPLLREVEIAGTTETVMYGGDRNFDFLAQSIGNIGNVAVIGWSSQGPAQAQNLRDSLAEAGTDTKVVVGLREGSTSRAKAEAVGFNEEDGTLTTVEKAIKQANLSLLLIADAALVREGKRLMDLAPIAATIGLSHGFLLGHYEATGQTLREDIDVIGVCPKGMGPSVRRLYEQGSGINVSFAVEQGRERARDTALAWSLGLGAPFAFQTTLGNEWRSDVFGERAMLLGGVHGTVEALYGWKRQHDISPERAYTEVVESIVGPISEAISHEGLEGLYEQLSTEDQEKFADAYNAAYPRLRELTNKIYNDVSSRRELAEVVSDNEHNVPMTEVDGADMWRAGERVREAMDEERRKQLTIDPVVAGVYIAGMMAQVDVLREHGHHWSEVVNESIIEAVDSLNPYMRAQGVAYMVDNCSITARRGSRKWAPAYQAWISQGVLPVIDGIKPPEDHDYFGDFVNHDVHEALRVLGEMRPSIDIAVA